MMMMMMMPDEPFIPQSQVRDHLIEEEEYDNDNDNSQQEIDLLMPQSQLRQSSAILRASEPLSSAMNHQMFKSERLGKVVNDPVHQHMYFSGKLCDCIDTQQMQRLRVVKCD